MSTVYSQVLLASFPRPIWYEGVTKFSIIIRVRKLI